MSGFYLISGTKTERELSLYNRRTDIFAHKERKSLSCDKKCRSSETSIQRVMLT